MTKLKIAICQTSPYVGNFDKNYETIKKSYEYATQNNCDIAVFAEGTIHGYYAFDLFQSKHFIDACMEKINDIAELTKNSKTAIIIGSATKSKTELPLNSAIVMIDGKVVHMTHKRRLANESACIDSRQFDTGLPKKPFTINGVKISMPICHDIWNEQNCIDIIQDSELVISINASPYYYGKLSKRHNVVKSLATKMKIPFIYMNDAGAYDGVLNEGGSFAYNPDGSLAMQLPQFKTKNTIINYDNGVLSSDENKEIPEDEDNFCPTIWEACCFGLKQYVDKNRFNGVVLGLSGGIDSAITATIAVDALGAEKVHTIMMPSRYTSKDSLDDANELIKNLGVTNEVIDIEPMVNVFEKSFKNLMQGTQADATEENIQARIRGNIIMSVSNKFGYLALTTGNKSENAVGYATLYGDMCGGFNVVKDIYKTDIFKICKWRNKDKEIIPNNIISKPPSAELRENQTDQDNLPEYEVLDEILKCFIEERKSVKQTIKLGFDKDTVEKIWKLLHIAEYKRKQSAVGLKLTSCDFDYDRLYPISNDFIWHELKKDK